jgi:flagellar basal-body rod modification protein FlgD
MTTTTATAHAAAASAEAGTSAGAVSNPNGMLGQNDFLKLMIAQLQAQDPLQPANTNEYITEIAQFTQVEQTTNLANANELSSAVGLIGRTVNYSTAKGTTGTGIVQSVQSNAAGTSVTIEGQSGVALSSITEVK